MVNHVRWCACSVVIFACPILVGCASKSMYDWGSYEGSLYDLYVKPENYSLEKDIDRLRKEVERSIERERSIPPGKCAHLAMLLTNAGDEQEALRFLEIERERFPESQTLIDRLAANLRRR